MQNAIQDGRGNGDVGKDLVPHLPQTFVFGGKKPLSYAQVRRMCDRIKRDTGFAENITPIRFRTTVLTDLYDQTKDIKLAQAAAGHTTIPSIIAKCLFFRQ